jgi:hypothetical protein
MNDASSPVVEPRIQNGLLVTRYSSPEHPGTSSPIEQIRWVSYEELEERFKRPDEESMYLIGIERRSDGRVYPIFGSRRIENKRSQDPPIRHQEILEVGLKIESFPIIKKEFSKDWPYLPEDIRSIFENNLLLITAREEESNTEYSVLMATEVKDDYILGRSGVLLKDGIPIVLEINGQEFFVELKMMGYAVGGFYKPHFRTSYRGMSKVITGGGNISVVEYEFRNLEIVRNASKKFTRAETIRNLGNIHFQRQDLLQGYTLRLSPSSIRAAYAGNDKFPDPKEAENTERYAYYLGEELAENLIVSPSLIHVSLHLEQLVIFEDG